ncbi:hypothetical protein MN608_03077 [Microdochium nivale]|nr:hypothetical protein MN608_03077 [Microdochium nivale]
MATVAGWNPDVDPGNRIIQPTGLALGVITTASIMAVLTTIFTATRTHVRIVDGVFGWDDGLMVAGYVTYMGAVIVGIWAHLIGIGTMDVDLNQWQFEESKKIHTVWLLVYFFPMTLVKASICVTLLRITGGSKRSLALTVWVLLAITMVSFVAAFVGTLLQCQPIEALWKPQLILEGKARCAPIGIFVALGYISTVCTIITDAALVLIPALVLWKAQMQFQAKLQVFTMLSVGSCASIITIVRIPYVQRYSNPTDQHYHIAVVVLCSLVETGIGCVAASFPSFRRLVMRTWYGQASLENSDNNIQDRNLGLVTFGSKQPGPLDRHGRFRSPSDKGTSLSTVTQGVKSRDHDVGDRSGWTRLQDGDDSSGKDESLKQDGAVAQGIRAEYSYQVETEPAPVERNSDRR